MITVLLGTNSNFSTSRPIHLDLIAYIYPQKQLKSLSTRLPVRGFQFTGSLLGLLCLVNHFSSPNRNSSPPEYPAATYGLTLKRA